MWRQVDAANRLISRQNIAKSSECTVIRDGFAWLNPSPVKKQSPSFREHGERVHHAPHVRSMPAQMHGHRYLAHRGFVLTAPSCGVY